jgi:predicted phosphoribosyltransferase
MPATPRFRDRTDAGEQLARALVERGVDPDLVLAVPRGGLPLGRAVADALDAPLDVVVASKIGAPGNPEYALGAVASDGTVWRNERAIRAAGASESYFGDQRDIEVPVGPPDTIRDLEDLADEVVCLATPAGFRGVGQFYDRFDQVSDAEATSYLDGS